MTLRSVLAATALAFLGACSNGTTYGSSSGASASHTGASGNLTTSFSASHSAGATSGDQACHGYDCNAGCSNGIVTMCDILSPLPGGCPSVEVATSFCPFGCNQDKSEDSCNYYPTDAGMCGASAATITTGMLTPSDGHAPQAVSALVSSMVRVTVATSLGAACTAGVDAGLDLGTTSGAFLTFLVPQSATGTVLVTGATLTVWKSGVPVLRDEASTSGSVRVTLQDFHTVSNEMTGDSIQGGIVGTYDVSFGSDVEQGSFIAPLCNACPAGP
jgi:hypothetical protein